jgi:homoserine O-acetyltransferase
VKRTVLAALAGACALASAAQVPALQYGSLGDFRLHDGQVIRDCVIAYRTLGALNKDKSNAILFPTWFSGGSEDLAPLAGPEGLVDPTRFFLILVDALGDGHSSSPSNSKLQPRMQFPRFTIADMVAAEHRLVTEKLGIRHLHAVIGISMGGMQTYQWVVSYPGFLSKAVPIVGSPRLTAYDRLLWQSEASAIEEDRDWNGGNYTKPPVLNAVAEIHSLALTTPAYRVRETSPTAFPEFLKGVDRGGLGRMDANDWLRQLQAMMSLDVSAPFGGSMEKAAAVVRAEMLIVPSMQDHMVNPTPALDFAHLRNAKLYGLTGDCGHLATGCESAHLYPAVRAFLAAP